MSNCQHTGPRGQCTAKTVTGSEFCNRHSNEADRIRSYRISDPTIRERFDHHSSSSALETVREEVVFLRTLIEERYELARTEADKVNAFSVIHPALSTLNKLVESLSKLELQADLVLGRDALNKLGDDIVTILIEELSNVDGYTEIVDRVASRLATTIAQSRNK
jgi:hypothetical protein